MFVVTNLTPLLEKRSDWYSRAELHSVTASGVVLESRTAAAVVSQLNRRQCEDRIFRENTRRAGRGEAGEYWDRPRQSLGCPALACV